MLRQGTSMFQFHSGLIKSEQAISGRMDRGTFQFHSGLIKSFAEKMPTLYLNNVSIPFWSD